MPYVTHPIAVTQFLINDLSMTWDQEILSASLLHDCVEDTSASIEEIQFLFGDTIGSLVSGVTKPVFMPEHVTDIRERKHEAREKYAIQMAEHPDLRVILIKASDWIANLRDIEGCTQGETKRMREKTQKYYLPLLDNLARRESGWADTISFLKETTINALHLPLPEK